MWTDSRWARRSHRDPAARPAFVGRLGRTGGAERRPAEVPLRVAATNGATTAPTRTIACTHRDPVSSSTSQTTPRPGRPMASSRWHQAEAMSSSASAVTRAGPAGVSSASPSSGRVASTRSNVVGRHWASRESASSGWWSGGHGWTSAGAPAPDSPVPSTCSPHWVDSDRCTWRAWTAATTSAGWDRYTSSTRPAHVASRTSGSQPVSARCRAAAAIAVVASRSSRLAADNTAAALVSGPYRFRVALLSAPGRACCFDDHTARPDHLHCRS